MDLISLWTPQMVFTILTTGALYKSVEKLFELICEKYFQKPMPRQICIICLVACYFGATALLAGIFKVAN